MKYLKTFESKNGISFEEWVKKYPIKKDTKTLYCYNNNITDLNGIEKYTQLTSLEIFMNHIIDLTPIENMTNLTKILCSNNDISTINLEKLINLKVLNISSNNLTNLDIPKRSNLIKLNCSKNSIEELDLINAIKLEELTCSDNKIKIIDNAEKCLKRLHCEGNNLPYHNVEGYWEWYYKYHDDRAEAEKFNF